jgi:UDP-N-acetylmuramoylalanine--D-glutamate ligase
MTELVKSHISSLRRKSNVKSIVHDAGTLENAVKVAAQVAEPGDVVLLSPGGTSFDAFKDFAERGDRFIEYVNGLE